jgi:hypothetical protein
MKRALSAYQYLGPLILAPLAAWAWVTHYGDWVRAAPALLVPVIHAYVVPAVGTNVLGMWEFDTKLKLGRFRPHHGFVFGSATALIAWPLIGAPLTAWDPGAALTTSLRVGAVLLAVNWAYDAAALRYGILRVYTPAATRGAGPWRAAADYVVPFFGLFGVIYAGGLRLAEPMLIGAGPGAAFLATLVISAACIGLTSAAYVAGSFLVYGHAGLKPGLRESPRCNG